MRTWTLAAIALLLLPLAAHAATADLSITQGGITFSKNTFYAGDVVRIYAKVRNLGETDMTATVYFYQGPTLIAAAQPISLPAEGAPEEVFIDFTVPSGSFNIRAVIEGAEPTDENASNDEATTPLYTAIADADRDGVEDANDNCVSTANADQTDTDHDGVGDACDTDDDGDGLSDSKESTLGTDPVQADTDNDGVNDKNDSDPLHVPAAAPAPEPAPAPVTQIAKTPVATPSVPAAVAADTSADAEELAVAMPTSAYGVLNVSPRAYFSYIQNDWNSFDFSVQSPQDGMTYTWDFGDGSTSALPTVTHDFDGPGGFTVTLTTRDSKGTEDSDVQDVTVSFWSLQNPWVQAMLGFFAVLLMALGVLLFTMRRAHAVGDDNV